MRVAAGVLLIILAVFYVVGGLGLLVGGAVVGSAGSIAKMAEEQNKKAGTEMTAEQKAAMAELEKGGAKAGGMLLAYGGLMLVTAGVGIAGAVSLFQQKRQKLIFAAGGMVAICLVVGLISGGFGIGTVLSGVTAVLTFLAGKSIGTAAA
jgi:hypothetical protein